jgi:SAM-dependent methyltransferase
MNPKEPLSGGVQRTSEAVAVAERYARRRSGSLYSMLRPEVILSTQEWQRKMLYLLGSTCGYSADDLGTLKVVDVGCGFGGHLLDFMRFGIAPHNLRGIELLADRVALARTRVPASVEIHAGDANSANIDANSQDIVFQSVVFSSLLSDSFQQELAERMWSWVRPGGGVMWYEFVYNNPGNPDVRGVPLKRVRQLFPHAAITARRVTLAPPISRRVCRIHPIAYPIFNSIPWLRTHVLCWIRKST